MHSKPRASQLQKVMSCNEQNTGAPNKSVSLDYAASLGPLLRNFDTDNHSGDQGDRGFSSTHFIIIRTRKKEPADSCIAS